MKILIADDHKLFRDGLKHIITEKLGSVSFVEVNNYAELSNILNELKCDIAIIDLNMPGRSGIDALKDIKSVYANLPVIVLSMYPEEQFALRVIKAGASAYLTKDANPTELITAIKSVAGGNVFFTEKVARIIAKDLALDKKNTLDVLSDREFQVLLMIASGKSLTEIAKELSLSVKTISTHRSHILEKLNLNSNSDLTRFALDNELL